jgi:hypothetical protein
MDRNFMVNLFVRSHVPYNLSCVIKLELGRAILNYSLNMLDVWVISRRP